MWKRLLNALKSATIGHSVPASEGTAFYVYRVKRPEGDRDIVSLVPDAFEFGLSGEAIVGEYTRLLEEGERVTEASFRPNPAFVTIHTPSRTVATPTRTTLPAEEFQLGA